MLKLFLDREHEFFGVFDTGCPGHIWVFSAFCVVLFFVVRIFWNLLKRLQKLQLLLAE